MVVHKSYKKWLIVCFVSMMLAYGFHRLISSQIKFVTHSVDFFRIQDYAYIIILIKAFWFEGFGNIYELSFQQQALSSYVGSQIYTVMPFGYTPLALVVLFPFAYAACFSMAISYTLWVVFSLGVLFIALWNVGRYIFQKQQYLLLPITLCLFVIFSAIMFFAIYIGHTSILAVGLLINLIYILHKGVNESQSDNVLLITLLVFVLGIKPPYLALGLGLLMIYGRRRQLFCFAALAIMVLVGITPMLTLDWISSYLHQIQLFSYKGLHGAYAWSLMPETMNIFRSGFRGIIGDDLASLVSNVIYYSVYLSVVGLSCVTKIKDKLTDRLPFLRVTKGQLFILLVASYLLFAPYANAYEDILLLSVFVVVLITGNTPPLTNYKSLTIFIVFFVILNQKFFPPDKPLWFFWILKALFLAYMLNFCRLQHDCAIADTHLMAKD